MKRIRQQQRPRGGAEEVRDPGKERDRNPEGDPEPGGDRNRGARPPQSELRERWRTGACGERG